LTIWRYLGILESLSMVISGAVSSMRFIWVK